MSQPSVDQQYAEAAVLRAKQQEEYGQYVAKQLISIGGVPAFNVGDPVPVSHVERFNYLEDGLVVKRGEGETEQSAPQISDAAPLSSDAKKEEGGKKS
jgi:hypothetical protein